jgi:hypothetical protein
MLLLYNIHFLIQILLCLTVRFQVVMIEVNNNVNMNIESEIIHHTHVANQMLHDAFEREYIHMGYEHVEYMDGVVDHGNEPKHLMQVARTPLSQWLVMQSSLTWLLF